uniref:uncharacterized protein LOC122609557 n=1 Tax=Erigeron canadensis TaxID=72917 RepID=UPI001CB95937|nr:uncharacterized protein LOC122609557 [Erigeron canadensis]
MASSSSSSNHSRKPSVGSKQAEKEEIVRYMSNLPSYLERGKPVQDRALSFGVMDWGRLEQWQYYHQKLGAGKNDIFSPSTSNSSLLSSTDLSSHRSSRGQKSSHDPIKSHHVTLQSHLNISPKDISSKDSPVNLSSQKKTTTRSRHKSKFVKENDTCPQGSRESKSSDDTKSIESATLSSSSKGKMKIEDELINKHGNFQDPSYGIYDGTLFERHKALLLNDEKREDFHSDLKNDIPVSFLSEYKVVSRKNSKNVANLERISNTPCQIETPEEKELNISSTNSDFKKGGITASKHRFSFSTSSKSVSHNSTKKAIESPLVSQNSTKYDSSVSQRTNLSPLKRLLDPLFSSKATYLETSREDSKIKAKVKMDLGSCKEVRVDNSCQNKSSTKQALFQMAVRNGRPLFTFAVDNNNDILAATVRSLSGKDDTNSWLYTFFTIQEVRKKKGGWLSHGRKGDNHGYLPNVVAQMTVSNRSSSNSTSREFVLSSMDPGQTDPEIVDAELENELAAIVVQFLRKGEEEENQDCFSTTVILPGGHSVPRKGEPSPLIERWRSGGVCDCGGWDVGCRLRILANKAEFDRRSRSPENFELFFQGDVVNERPFFSLSPLKDEIYSVEYNTSLTLLHAFSICISVIECRQSSQHTELRTYVAKVVDGDESPVAYVSLPPVSPVGRV